MCEKLSLMRSSIEAIAHQLGEMFFTISFDIVLRDEATLCINCDLLKPMIGQLIRSCEKYCQSKFPINNTLANRF